MRINSFENQAVWYGAGLAVLGESVLLAIFHDFRLACLGFCISMLLLNLACFLEGRPRRVMQILGVILMAGGIVLVPRWYMGSLSLLLVSGIFFEHRRVTHAMGLLLAIGALVTDLLITRPNILGFLLNVSLALAIYGLWEVLLFALRKFAMTEAQLNQALTASSVDAMEQRKLREELGKMQSTNEYNARLQERERISRDIHNQVGHTLSAATVTLDAATLLMPSDAQRAKEKIDIANSRVHEAISSVRSVVRTLDAEDDRIALNDYMHSLQNMVSDFMMDTEIKVYHNFGQIESEERIPMQTASFLSSSLKELLTNGVKHGQAKIFVVTFLRDEKNLRLKVQDNGSGWGFLSSEEKRQRINRGFGLRKMIDYAEKKGGNCTIESVDGFAVCISLPVEG